MFSFTVKSFCNYLSWNTEFAELENFFKTDPFYKVHLPNAELVEKVNSNTKNIFNIYHKTGTKFEMTLDYNSKTLTIEIPLSKHIHTAQYVFLCIPIISRLLEENSYYRLHCASLERNKQGILILGESKSGKSILSTLLSLDYKFTLWGDECCVMDLQRGYVVAGNDVVSLRRDSIKDDTASRIQPYLIKQSKVTLKYYLMLPKTPSLHTRVSMIISPYFSEWHVPKIERVDAFDTAISLYENITASIRSVLSFLYVPEVGFPSLDTQALSDKRIKLIKDFLDRSKVVHYSVTGNLESICKFIAKLV